MSALTASKPENISNLLVMDEEYPAPQIVVANAIQKDWLGECARSRKDPEAFWAEYAESFAWSRKWNRVLEWDGVHHRWFTGGKTNITINALDRHAESEPRRISPSYRSSYAGAATLQPSQDGNVFAVLRIHA